MLSLFLLLACADPPKVDQLDPKSGLPGVTLRILGENLPADASATLGGQPLPELTVRGSALIEARVPEGLAPGPQELVLSGGGVELLRLPGAFVVEKQEEDLPCAGRYTAYSAVAMDSNSIKIDKFYTAEDRHELVDLPLPDVVAIEYEELAQPDGKVCSVIFVRTKDTKRYMFDDDTEIRLRDRAQEMAVGLGKDFKVGALVEPPAPTP